MNSTLLGSDRRSLLRGLALLCVVATSLAGCTTRRQYAINESILIGERRQLEDEIYRVQFELRDALEENERLRAELEELDPRPDKNGKKRKASSRDAKTTAPAYERPQTNDEIFFPGGDALRVNMSGYNERRADAASRQASYLAPRRSPKGVSQVAYDEYARQEAREDVEEELEETEDAELEYVEEELEETEDAELEDVEEEFEETEDAELEYVEEETMEEEDGWSPLPE